MVRQAHHDPELVEGSKGRFTKTYFSTMEYEELIESFADPEDGDATIEEPKEGSDDEGAETEKSKSDEDDEGIDLENPQE